MAKQEEINYTKYEKARMIGSRALQIGMGAPFLVKVSKEKLAEIKYNPIEVAKMEFSEGVIPITVKRPLPDSFKTKKYLAKRAESQPEKEAKKE